MATFVVIHAPGTMIGSALAPRETKPMEEHEAWEYLAWCDRHGIVADIALVTDATA